MKKLLSVRFTLTQTISLLFLIPFTFSFHPIIAQFNVQHQGVLYGGDGDAPHLGMARASCISGNYAYVMSSKRATLQIIDISDPANPQTMGFLKDGRGTAPFLKGSYAIAVSGNFAYIASDAYKTFEVVDISNPYTPVHAGSLAGSEYATPYMGYVTSISIQGNYAYLSCTASNALEIIDISNPANPAHKGAIRNFAGGAPHLRAARSVNVIGNYAYLVSGTNNALEVIDISNPANPTHAGALTNGTGGTLLDNPMELVITGNYAYITNYNSNSIEIINISSPTSPSHAASLVDGSGGALLSKAYGLEILGNHLFVASENNFGIEVVNISNPLSPVHAGSIGDGDGTAKLKYGNQLMIHGNHLLVCGENNVMEVVDISTPSLPLHSTTLLEGSDTAPLFYSTNDMAIYGNFAFVVNLSKNAIDVINISNRAKPFPVAIINDGENGANLKGPIAIQIAGNYAYIACANGNAIEIIDISDPLNPTHEALIEDGTDGAKLQYPMSIKLQGDYAYVVSNVSSAVEIIDISNPSSPTHVSSITDGSGGAMLSAAQCIDVQGDYAYVGIYGGLEILDITNPSSPTHSATLIDGGGIEPFLSAPVYLQVRGNYAYINDNNSSAFEIVDVSDPANPVHKGALQDYGTFAYLFGISLQGDSAFICDNTNNNVNIINISDPANPSLSQTIHHGNNGAVLSGAYNLKMDEKFIYVLSAESQALEILSIYPPDNLTATNAINIYANHFNANWNTSSGAVEYELDVSSDNFITFVPGYNALSLDAPDTLRYVDGLNPATTYQYRVRAVNASGTTINSNTIAVLTVPAAPAADPASNVTSSSFTANWQSTTGASGYLLDVSTDNFSTFITGFNGLSVSGTSLAVSGLTAGTDYQYRVRAVNASGASINSDTIIASITLGISSSENTQAIYCRPNPSERNITIHMNEEPRSAEVKIYHANGSLVVSGNEELINTPILVQDLAPGVYTIQVITNSGVSNLKFIKR